MPDEISRRFTPTARVLPDTDWYVDRLFPQAEYAGFGVISARFSRYVIDLNRPPDNAALYAAKTPGLVPVETFSGESIYTGEKPDQVEITARLESYWQPYHAAISGELERLKAKHGYAILLDAHSIHSRVPSLFSGTLPDLNLGSFEGRSAEERLIGTAMAALEEQSVYTHVLDGRFKGGYITRHYGNPPDGVHALQLEMSQAMYMDEMTLEFDAERAGNLQQFLHLFAQQILGWNPPDD